MALSPRERFAALVSPTLNARGCSLWYGPLFGKGPYGLFYLNGRSVGAHRVAWALKHGPIPRGKFVLHSCDTPLCVADEHLFLGDHAANMADAASKGRIGGYRRSRLTAEQRDLIVRIASDYSPRQISRRFGCGVPLAMKIMAGVA